MPFPLLVIYTVTVLDSWGEILFDSILELYISNVVRLLVAAVLTNHLLIVQYLKLGPFVLAYNEFQFKQIVVVATDEFRLISIATWAAGAELSGFGSEKVKNRSINEQYSEDG